VTSIPAIDLRPELSTSLAETWSAFDAVFCISLIERSDRRQKARHELQRVGLADQVQFFLVERHMTNSEEGIYESHMACLRAALAAGAQSIVIFEDDILFRRFSPETLDDAVRFMKTDAHWQAFFFGCFVKRSRKTAYPSVIQVKYRCAAHAYVVHRRLAERLVRIPWQGMAYDDLLRSLDVGKYYACYPTFGFQSGSATDNTKTIFLDRLMRRICGLRWLQRWDEFSKRHAYGMIGAHLAFLTLIVLIVLTCLGKL
jgi:GR25 family glycosyltransferase involved in LPS biosynthesis